MRFDKIIPQQRLQLFISQFVIAENEQESVYKVFPSTAPVLGLQYEGKLKTGRTGLQIDLTTAGISGIADQLQWFANSANTKSILIYFTELGWAHFSTCPAHELFNRHVSLDDLFDQQKVQDVKQQLAEATTDQQRISSVEQFLLVHLRGLKPDPLILQAVKLIHQSRGAIRISELNRRLMISQSPLEKRFRNLVGTTPKKFASLVRFNAILTQLREPHSLMDICFEHNFFDQAHFSKAFKIYTGESPDSFKRLLE